MATFLALGDSYTIGEGVAAHERWPMQLAARLTMAGLQMRSPTILATTGWTQQELEAELPRMHRSLSWDLVSLLIGVNDQYRGLETDRFSDDYSRLLEGAISFAGGRPERVFAVSIPDWGRTPFGKASGRDLERISAEIDWCNEEQAEQCRRRNVAHLDITEITRAAGSGSGAVVDDGLHPNAGVYRQWARLLAPPVAELMKFES